MLGKGDAYLDSVAMNHFGFPLGSTELDSVVLSFDIFAVADMSLDSCMDRMATIRVASGALSCFCACLTATTQGQDQVTETKCNSSSRLGHID